MINRKKVIQENAPTITVLPNVERVGAWTITLLLFPRAEHSSIHIQGPEPHEVYTANQYSSNSWGEGLPYEVHVVANRWMVALKEFASERS